MLMIHMRFSRKYFSRPRRRVYRWVKYIENGWCSECLRERSGVEIKGKTMDIVLFCLNSNSQYNIGAARVACPICFVLRPVSHPCAHRRSKCCVFGWKFKLIRTVIVIFFLYIYVCMYLRVCVCVCVLLCAWKYFHILFSKDGPETKAAKRKAKAAPTVHSLGHLDVARVAMVRRRICNARNYTKISPSNVFISSVPFPFSLSLSLSLSF